MQKGWVKTAGAFKVEHVPCPHPGVAVDLNAPAKGLLHTTEGSTIEGALAVFRKRYAPHFTVGRDSKRRVRILQHVPLGMMASALENDPGGVETNRVVRVQVELVGKSSTQPWLPDTPVLAALASLMAELARLEVVPLARPYADELPPLPWATESFKRRNVTKWLAVPGWFGHIDTPENSHWDPGALKWSELLADARGILFDLVRQQQPGPVAPKPPTKPPAAKPRVVDKVLCLRLVMRAGKLVKTEQIACPPIGKGKK